MKSLRLVYATLLQAEYILALMTGVLLGAEKWLYFSICLILSLALGFVTTALYWHLFDKGLKNEMAETVFRCNQCRRFWFFRDKKVYTAKEANEHKKKIGHNSFRMLKKWDLKR